MLRQSYLFFQRMGRGPGLTLKSFVNLFKGCGGLGGGAPGSPSAEGETPLRPKGQEGDGGLEKAAGMVWEPTRQEGFPVEALGTFTRFSTPVFYHV